MYSVWFDQSKEVVVTANQGAEVEVWNEEKQTWDSVYSIVLEKKN